MQALTCNICGRRMHGPAFELMTLRGRPVPLFDGGTAIANRQATRWLQLCSPCGSWVQLGMRTIRQSFEETLRLEQDARWITPLTPARTA